MLLKGNIIDTPTLYLPPQYVFGAVIKQQEYSD